MRLERQLLACIVTAYAEGCGAHTAGFPSAFRRVRHTLSPLWSLVPPGLFALSCWLLLLDPDKASTCVPSLRSSWLLGGPPTQHKTATLPSSRSAAYQLGYIAGKLNSQVLDPSLLHTAAGLLALPEEEVTAEVMASLGQAFRELDQGGVGGRLLGLFNFVNFIWCLSIVGISVSVTPVIFLFAKPLMRFVRAYAKPFVLVLFRCAVALQPAFQAVLFWLCFYIVAAAARYPNSYNHFVALSGCIMSLPIFFWTCKHAVASGLWPIFTNTFLFLVLTPVAVMYHSSLIGFLSSAALFGALGLSAIPTGLAWHVGFSSRSDLHRVACTSFVIMYGLVAVRATQVDPAVLLPFQAGLSLFGSIGLFLAGLIETSGYHTGSRRYIGSSMWHFCWCCCSLCFWAVFSILQA